MTGTVNYAPVIRNITNGPSGRSEECLSHIMTQHSTRLCLSDFLPSILKRKEVQEYMRLRGES